MDIFQKRFKILIIWICVIFLYDVATLVGEDKRREDSDVGRKCEQENGEGERKEKEDKRRGMETGEGGKERREKEG